MAKTSKRKTGKKAAGDPDLQSMIDTKRKLRNIDRAYNDIGRMVSAITSKRARLDMQLRQFANATIERLDRENADPFNAPTTNH